jgi:hypothetical protein
MEMILKNLSEEEIYKINQIAKINTYCIQQILMNKENFYLLIDLCPLILIRKDCLMKTTSQ